MCRVLPFLAPLPRAVPRAVPTCCAHVLCPRAPVPRSRSVRCTAHSARTRHTFRYFDIPCRFENGKLNRVSAGRTLTVPCLPLARSAQWQTRTTYDYRSPLAGRDCHQSGSTFRPFRQGLPQPRKHLPLRRMLARTNQEPSSLYRSSSPRPTRSREPAVPLEVHPRTTPHEPTNASQHASHTSTRATPAREPTPASHTL